MQIVLLITVVAVAMVANIAAQMISHRRVFRGQLVSSLVCGLVFGLLALTAGLAVAPPIGGDGFSWFRIGGLLIYLALSFTFLCLVAASETSVRLQILRELSADPRGLTPAELDRSYSNGALVRTRLIRLISSGEIIKVNDVYWLTSGRLLLVARLFRACKLLIFGMTNEFDVPPRQPWNRHRLGGR